MATTKKTPKKEKKVPLQQPAADTAPAAQAETTAPAAEPAPEQPAAEEKAAQPAAIPGMPHNVDAAYKQMFTVLNEEPEVMTGIAVRYRNAEGELFIGQFERHNSSTGLSDIYVATMGRTVQTFHRLDTRKPAEHSYWEIAGHK